MVSEVGILRFIFQHLSILVNTYYLCDFSQIDKIIRKENLLIVKS